MNKETLLVQRNKQIGVIRVKDVAAYPLPKFYELRMLLDSFTEFTSYKIAFAIMAIQGLRPIEVTRLSRDCFIYNTDKTKIISMQYYAYKARNNKNKFATFKLIKKPMYSEWLSTQIINYLALNSCLGGTIFSFTTADMFNKTMSNIRKKGKIKFMHEKITETLVGQNNTQYRISPYALRRFAFTFHYWITYKQEAVTLAKIFGHSKVDTTLSYYVFPKESIGLTDEDLENPLSIDEYLGFNDRYNKVIESHIVNTENLINETTQNTETGI